MVLFNPPLLQPQDTQVRSVALLPGERVVHYFTPRQGLVDGAGPPETGRLLVATNQRILSFSPDTNATQVVLVPVEEVKGVVVKTSERSGSGYWLQGMFLALAGVLIYAVAGYWLVGRFGGPEVPFINVDLGALILLLGIAGGVWFLGRHYFSREDSSVTFQGSSWSFAFPFRGEKAEEEIYQVVNGLFASRQPGGPGTASPEGTAAAASGNVPPKVSVPPVGIVGQPPVVVGPSSRESEDSSGAGNEPPTVEGQPARTSDETTRVGGQPPEGSAPLASPTAQSPAPGTSDH